MLTTIKNIFFRTSLSEESRESTPQKLHLFPQLPCKLWHQQLSFLKALGNEVKLIMSQRLKPFTGTIVVRKKQIWHVSLVFIYCLLYLYPFYILEISVCILLMTFCIKFNINTIDEKWWYYDEKMKIKNDAFCHKRTELLTVIVEKKKKSNKSSNIYFKMLILMFSITLICKIINK